MPVEVSTKQMALTRNIEFMERVTAMLSMVAGTILSEPVGTPHHQPRAFYAQNVVRGPSQAATVAGPQVVMGINISSTTTYDEATKTSTCTATDLDLQSQITTLWNALAGIDSPS